MNSQNMQSIPLTGAGNFKFSAVRPDDLGATEYTLVTVVVDTTGSVMDFATELKDSVKAIIDACRKSPRADNLLVRLVTFNEDIDEVFGFKELNDIDTNNIDDFKPNGLTALYDATFDAVGATEQYAEILYNQEFDANAAVYVITDGWDNRSRYATAKKIAEKVSGIRQDESLESIITMLIGVNTANSNVRDALQEYSDDGKFSQYVDAGDATASNLAKLAGFVSKSISSQSQALGTGAPSQSLSF